MNIVRLFAVLGCLVLVLPASAEDKAPNKDKIVGTWEIVKSDSKIPAGSTLEFTKDGKITMKLKNGDETFTVPGTYQIEGDQLKTVMTFKGEEMKETMTIKTLTDKAFVTVDKKGNKDEFKKK
jgi:uncharacterized protein (TIGR03066 family)